MTGLTAAAHPERTALAENRTSASTLIVGVALVRTAVVADSGLATVTALAGVVVCLMGLAFSWVDYVDRHDRNSRRRLLLPRSAAASAVSVALLSVAGLATALA